MTFNCTSVRIHLLAILFCGTLLVGASIAQSEFPRLGLSAENDHYVGQLNAEIGDTITLYVGAFGSESGVALDEAILSFGWAIFQVCCGADLLIVDFEYIGDFSSQGHPLAGVNSVAPECVSGEFMLLAVLDILLLTPDGPGDYTISAGPTSATINCAGETKIFAGAEVVVTATGEISPTVNTSWSGLKAIFR